MQDVKSYMQRLYVIQTIFILADSTKDNLLQGTRRFGELGGKQWKPPQTSDSIYPILFSTYVHFRNFNITHI